MATSVIEVCSMAVSRVGGNSITSIDSPTTKEERLCALFYPRVRDSVLRSLPWNTATRRASIAADVNAPAFGFATRYAKPPNCLRILRLENEDDVWRLEGQWILTNVDELNVYYIIRLENPNQWDSMMLIAIYLALAIEISMGLKQSTAKTNEIKQAFAEVIADARTINAQESSLRVIDTSSYLNSRLTTLGPVFSGPTLP